MSETTDTTPERVEALTDGEMDQINRLMEVAELCMVSDEPGYAGTCSGAAGSLRALREKVAGQVATIAELRAEVEYWERENEKGLESLRGLNRECLDMQAEVERKDAALRRYGDHEGDCMILSRMAKHLPVECSCGFDRALAPVADQVGETRTEQERRLSQDHFGATTEPEEHDD